jgi:hypothetical protein
MTSTIPTHQEVDFLPREYRQQHARRRQLAGQFLVGVALVGLVAATAGGQAWWRHRVQRELDQVTPLYQTAVNQSGELSKLQAELEVAQAEAQLITYLRHPWPSSQLLSALVGPLPEAIAFREIRITHEPDKSPVLLGPRPDKQTLEQQLARLPKAGRDLKALREQFDRAPTLLSLSGLATDSDAVYRYLGELSKNRLLAKVELVSLDNAADRREDKLEFKLNVLVRPGYGLPDGPAAPPVAVALPKPRAKGAEL